MRILVLAGAAVLSASSFGFTLGSFTFNDNQFGDSLIESDGGSFSSGNWLNTANANPGNPGYLTGANVETGIANIGFSGSVTYTIGYNTPIVNLVGDDLGVIVARYSANDFMIAVSEDGVNFGSDILVPASGAGSTGEFRSYYYAGSGPYGAYLYVHSMDLTNLGVSLGNSVAAVRITGFNELDLIRAAGMNPVPEPASILALASGALVVLRRRRK